MDTYILNLIGDRILAIIFVILLTSTSFDGFERAEVEI